VGFQGSVQLSSQVFELSSSQYLKREVNLIHFLHWILYNASSYHYSYLGGSKMFKPRDLACSRE
jgi:hypothetical protein